MSRSSITATTTMPTPTRRPTHRRSSGRDGYGSSVDSAKRRSRVSTTSTSSASSSSLANEWRAHEEDQATRVIQRAVRAHLSRRRLTRLVRRIYDKRVDPITLRVFYVNLLTNESSWDPPALLARFGSSKARDDREFDDEPLVGIPKKGMNQALSKRDAVERIQRLVRSFLARKFIRSLVRELYMKLVDPKTRTFYYLNTRTGARSDEKPPFFRRIGKRSGKSKDEIDDEDDLEIERFLFRQAVCKMSTATAASGSAVLGRYCGRLCLLCDAEALPNAEAAQSARVTCNYAPDRIPFPVLLINEQFFSTIQITPSSSDEVVAFTLCAVDEAQFISSTSGNLVPICFEENDRKLGCVAAVDGVVRGDLVEVVSHPTNKLQAVRPGRVTCVSPNGINPQRLSLEWESDDDADNNRGLGRGGVVFTRGGKLVGMQRQNGDKSECWTLHAILTALTDLVSTCLHRLGWRLTLHLPIVMVPSHAAPPAPLLLATRVASSCIDAYWHLPRRWRPQQGLEISFELEICALEAKPTEASSPRASRSSVGEFVRVYAGSRSSSHVEGLGCAVLHILRCRVVTGMKKSAWSDSARVRTLPKPSIAWRLQQCSSSEEAVTRLRASRRALDRLAVLRSIQWLTSQFEKVGFAQTRDDESDDDTTEASDGRQQFEMEVEACGGFDELFALVLSEEGPSSELDGITAQLLTLQLLTGMTRLKHRTLQWLTLTAQIQGLCEFLDRIASLDDSTKESRVIATLELLGVLADGSASAAHACVQLGDVVPITLHLVAPPALTDREALMSAEAVAAEGCRLLSKLAYQHDVGKWAIMQNGGIASLCHTLSIFHESSAQVLYWSLLTLGHIAYALPPIDEDDPDNSIPIDEAHRQRREEFDADSQACALVMTICTCRAHYLTHLRELELALAAAQTRLDAMLAMAMGEEARNEIDAAHHEVSTLEGAIADWTREDVAQAADYALRYVLTPREARVQRAATRILRKFQIRRLEMAFDKWAETAEFDRQCAIIKRMLATVTERQLRPAFRKWEQLVSFEQRQRKSKSVLYAMGATGLALDLGKKKRERYRMLVLQK